MHHKLTFIGIIIVLLLLLTSKLGCFVLFPEEAWFFLFFGEITTTIIVRLALRNTALHFNYLLKSNE
jgi:hypothetical protein